MGRVRDIVSKLKQFAPERMGKEVLQIVADHESVITQMNTDQLWEGRRSDGSTMPDYSPVSVLLYGKPAGPIRLFDQGDFYRGFTIDAGQFPVKSHSTDGKSSMLEREYGSEIFGITKDNQKSLNMDYLLEPIRERYREILHI